MKSLKTTMYIVLHNYRKWLVDYRIWIIAIILLILIHDNISNLVDLSNTVGVEMSIWIFPFLYSQYHQKLIFTIPLILLFCNAPFLDRNSLFVIKRSGKSLNTVGQLIYVIMTAFIYYLFIFLACLAFSIPYCGFSGDWGKIFNIIAYTNTSSAEGYHFLDASGFVMTYFTPVLASWFTLLMSWLTGSFIGLIIYALNIITRTKYIGTVIGSVIIIFSSFVTVFGTKKMLFLSPISWNTLDNLDVGGFTNNPSFYYCLFFILVAIIMLSMIILFASKKIDLLNGE